MNMFVRPDPGPKRLMAAETGRFGECLARTAPADVLSLLPPPGPATPALVGLSRHRPGGLPGNDTRIVGVHFCLEGATRHERRFRGADRQAGVFRPGAMVVAPPDCWTDWRWSGAPAALDFYVHEDQLREVMPLELAMTAAQRFIIQDPQVLALADQLREHAASGREADLWRWLDALARLLDRLAGCDPDLEDAFASRDSLIAALEALLPRRLSTTQIAETFGLSLSGFSRKVRRLAGTPPHTLMLELRIARARRLLETTSLSLSEIAQECGFCDQAHFATRFREQTGAPPSRWRRGAEV